MIGRLYLTRRQWQSMRRHVERQAPLEACGLLAGENNRVEEVLRIRNAAQSPVRFRMEPREQLQALRWIDEQGLDLVGIFHSHPAGPAVLSPTDIAESAYEAVHIIWYRDTTDWQARGFWIEGGKVKPVTLQIMDHEQP
jgi:proteasome lid subunit RPN8/RPN11